ncbi:hypothetical protein K438DRAFT_1975093 [Mycena galopus ATCC 62051]|nr:hypothetical protein K438DRAFT_1975093 [Mycena galopus ATCC 62051]
MKSTPQASCAQSQCQSQRAARTGVVRPSRAVGRGPSKSPRAAGWEGASLESGEYASTSPSQNCEIKRCPHASDLSLSRSSTTNPRRGSLSAVSHDSIKRSEHAGAQRPRPPLALSRTLPLTVILVFVHKHRRKTRTPASHKALAPLACTSRPHPSVGDINAGRAWASHTPPLTEPRPLRAPNPKSTVQSWSRPYSWWSYSSLCIHPKQRARARRQDEWSRWEDAHRTLPQPLLAAVHRLLPFPPVLIVLLALRLWFMIESR